MQVTTTNIKRDEHSLFVRYNSHIFRPVPAQTGPTRGYRAEETKLSENQQVRVKGIPESCFCRVRIGAREEFWQCHGTVMPEGREVRTAEVWAPMEDVVSVQN